ncbi:hypothetical protein GCM10009682_20780 [Luedemannella flava]|uniref:Uncharacterized protein n=1 Tax=Luedemannella flava TaxID=349316 RepID=A0ABN2LTH7_9ACTN
MDLAALETDVARLDAVYRPVATAPIPLDEVDGLGERIAAELAALGVEGEAEAVLRAVISRYAEGSDDDRAVIRGLFRRYTSFRWAAPLPGEWHGAAEFRTHVLRISACDQGADTRDDLLALRALCDQARKAGIDPAPILAEVAALSCDEDHYGMGSTRDILLRFASP